ncbi:MAG: type IV pilus assembly protein PilB, partial [Flavobacteriales bacterium]
MSDEIPHFLANTELFAHVPIEMLEKIAPACQVQRFFQNVIVFEQNTVAEHLYLVYSGSVALRRRDSLTGMEFLLALYGAGKSFGEEGVITDSPYPFSAQATEETHLLAIHKNDVRKMMQTLPQVSIASAQIMARRTNRFVAEKGVRYISLGKLNVDPEVLKLLPERLIREHKLLPVAQRGKTLTVAMVDPHNLVAYDEVQRAAREMYIEPVGIAESDFEKFIRVSLSGEAVSEGEHVLAALPQRNYNMRFVQEGAENISEAERTAQVRGDEVIQILNQVFGDALLLDASDIHMEPHPEEVVVRYRIDGKLMRRAETIPARFHNALVSRVKALASMDITERRRPADGRLGIMFNNNEVSLRLSTVPTRFGENLVVRVLDRSNALMSLDRIVLVPGVREMIRNLIFQPHGIVLVTGPTGSGKTTTMYSAILERKDEGVNIVTIEDPIEYTIPGITQVQFNDNVGLDYANAVRSFLRQDTDIMLIGETRDARTAHNAMQAALSGHLVVTSLHTNSALGSIYRLKEMGIEQFLLANALSGVIAQ